MINQLWDQPYDLITAQQNKYRCQMYAGVSTGSNTPEPSEYEDQDQVHDNFGFNFIVTQPAQQQFEIDVKPKKKSFTCSEEKRKFVEEYTKKLKTEICKNWETTGFCKFGDKCSFAHGAEQLKGKMHLHNNYKTKPCKKYYLKGYCSYGNRCQYLHRDLLLQKEFREFAEKVYAEK